MRRLGQFSANTVAVEATHAQNDSNIQARAAATFCGSSINFAGSVGQLWVIQRISATDHCGVLHDLANMGMLDGLPRLK